MSRILWMIGQALAIGGLTWGMVSEVRPNEPPMNAIGALAISVIVVAFATAVAVNVFDWARRKITGSPAKPARRDRGSASALLGRPGWIAKSGSAETSKPVQPMRAPRQQPSQRR